MPSKAAKAFLLLQEANGARKVIVIVIAGGCFQVDFDAVIAGFFNVVVGNFNEELFAVTSVVIPVIASLRAEALNTRPFVFFTTVIILFRCDDDTVIAGPRDLVPDDNNLVGIVFMSAAIADRGDAQSDLAALLDISDDNFDSVIPGARHFILLNQNVFGGGDVDTVFPDRIYRVVVMASVFAIAQNMVIHDVDIFAALDINAVTSGAKTVNGPLVAVAEIGGDVVADDQKIIAVFDMDSVASGAFLTVIVVIVIPAFGKDFIPADDRFVTVFDIDAVTACAGNPVFLDFRTVAVVNADAVSMFAIPACIVNIVVPDIDIVVVVDINTVIPGAADMVAPDIGAMAVIDANAVFVNIMDGVVGDINVIRRVDKDTVSAGVVDRVGCDIAIVNVAAVDAVSIDIVNGVVMDIGVFNVSDIDAVIAAPMGVVVVNFEVKAPVASVIIHFNRVVIVSFDVRIAVNSDFGIVKELAGDVDTVLGSVDFIIVLDGQFRIVDAACEGNTVVAFAVPADFIVVADNDVM